MSRITITGINSPVKQGKFFYIPLEYKDKGKDFTKKIMDFANRDVYNLLKNAKVGEEYDVAVEKDNNGYWQWKTVTKAAAAGASSGGTVASSTVRSTYETPEERAKRQMMIVRQSSLAQAVTYFNKLESAVPVSDVIELAEQFENWVMRETNTEENIDGE